MPLAVKSTSIANRVARLPDSFPLYGQTSPHCAVHTISFSSGPKHRSDSLNRKRLAFPVERALESAFVFLSVPLQFLQVAWPSEVDLTTVQLATTTHHGHNVDTAALQGHLHWQHSLWYHYLDSRYPSTNAYIFQVFLKNRSSTSSAVLAQSSASV